MAHSQAAALLLGLLLVLLLLLVLVLVVEGRTSRPAPLGGRREECWRSVEFGMS